MLEQIYNWILNISVYLIVVSAVMHAIPGKDYGKYIRFFSGLILILLLITPVLSLTGMKGRFDALYSGYEYELEKAEIERAGQMYEEADLAEYLPESGVQEIQGESREDESGSEERKIEVEEIEIGQ